MAADDEAPLTSRISSQVRFWAQSVWQRLKGLSTRAKLALLALSVFYMVLAFFLVVWPGGSKIGQALYNWAQRTSHLPHGWLIFVALITVVSFPPALGHTTCLVLVGFAYGLRGFVLAAGASTFAAAVVFVVLRLLFSSQLRAWSTSNEKWQALESVVRAKGLPLICLIRMSPFPPWPYSNALFASIGPVKLWQFVVAQIFVFPKILLSVFIGSRAAALADGDQRDKMDRVTKLLNIGLILISMSVGFATSWFVYRQVRQRIRHLEGVSPEVDELAAEAIEDEEAPLLGA